MTNTIVSATPVSSATQIPLPGQPLRVLHVLGSLTRGGVETWLMHVLRQLDGRRVRFDFVTHLDQAGAYDEEARALGARIFRCTAYRHPIRYARQLNEAIAAGGPYDVVHSHVHHYSGLVLRLAAQAGVPVRIAHSHNDTSTAESRSTLARRAYLWLMERWIGRHATRHLACSGAAGASLFGADWACDPRAEVLPYGIDLRPFAERYDRGAIADAMGIPVTAKVIGHVGRFDPQKNHGRVLEVASAVMDQDADVRLVLVGDGALRRSVEEHAGELGIRGRVVFAGLRADVPALMGGLFDVMLFPSLYEGLGLVVVEAQAAGVPVVMSDNVPADGIKMGHRVTRLPLSASDGTWAEAVRERLARRQDPRPPAHERLEALRVFDVRENVVRLEKVYRGPARRGPGQAVAGLGL